ncbi:hypothetical protein BB561_000461 [Smittium simulii]|uniref:Uncharacterized protein n=1 Tax=Smittium simulii TaxID=133385 RepID=A0A2T9YZ26_9FUNG|nr:hypothetical protein BB561_000461 [Smittium simulii]
MIKATFLYLFIAFPYFFGAQNLDKVKQQNIEQTQGLSKNNELLQENTNLLQTVNKNILKINLLKKKDCDNENSFEAETDLKAKLQQCNTEFYNHKTLIFSLFEKLNVTVTIEGIYDIGSYSRIGAILNRFDYGDEQISKCTYEIFKSYNSYANKSNEFVRIFHNKLVELINRRNEYIKSITQIIVFYLNSNKNINKDYKSEFEYIMSIVGSELS